MIYELFEQINLLKKLHKNCNPIPHSIVVRSMNFIDGMNNLTLIWLRYFKENICYLQERAKWVLCYNNNS